MFLSRRRLLLFVDEADAFLRKRSTVSLDSEHLCDNVFVLVLALIPHLYFYCAGEDQ